MEKTYEKGYNDVIIATTAEMKKVKNIIYQAGFEFGLENAQILIGHELKKMKVLPSDVFCATVEITYETKVLASTDDVVEHAEG